MVLTEKMSKIESSEVPLHFSQTSNHFILTNNKVLAILIFHVLAMPAVAAENISKSKLKCQAPFRLLL